MSQEVLNQIQMQMIILRINTCIVMGINMIEPESGMLAVDVTNFFVN